MKDIRPDVHYRAPKDIVPGTKVICRDDFDIVYADPPWCMGQSGEWGAIKHYALLPLPQIMAMPVADFCKDNAVCFLWIVAGPEGQKAGEAVLEAWGFKWVDRIVGIKPGLGLGSRTRHCYETCLIGVKGKMPVDFHGQPDWLFFPRQDHSHKPEEMYAIIERMHQNKDYLELFARKRPSNPNWYIWGNEAEGGSDIYIPGYPVPEYSDRVTFIPPVHKPEHSKEEA